MEAQYEWEYSKENAMPLKGGYKMARLNQALSGEVTREQLAKQQGEFEALVKANGGEDPLDNWKRYIAWATENNAASQVNIDIKALLERCVFAFRAYPEYKEDARYVKICLKYVDMCDDPIEMIGHLKDQSIGVHSLLLYKCWATYLEQARRYSEADDVYTEALESLAGEGDRGRIAQERASLQARQERYLECGSQSGDEEEEASIAPGRRTLGELRQGRKGQAPVDRVAGSKRKARGLGGVARAPQSNRASSNFQVFEEEDEEEVPRASKRSALGTGGRAFHSESVTTKENTQRAGAWNKQKGIGRAVTSIAPPTFEIFDDGSGEHEAGLAAPVKAQAAPVSVRNALDRRPRKAFGVHKAAPVPQLKNFARERGHTSRQIENGGLLMFEPALIYAETEEFCFEEIRGREYQSRCALQIAHDEDNGDVEMEAADSSDGLIAEAMVADGLPVSNDHTLLTGSPLVPAATPAKKAPLAARSVANTPNRPPSPTINTLAAMGDVAAMFGAPIGGGEPTVESVGSQMEAFKVFDENEAPAPMLQLPAAVERKPLGPSLVLGPAQTDSDTSSSATTAAAAESKAEGFEVYEDKTETHRASFFQAAQSFTTDASFTHSTPFSRGGSASAKAQPAFTPINNNHSLAGSRHIGSANETITTASHPTVQALRLSEGERTDTLSPIMEASLETSASSASTSASDGSLNVSAQHNQPGPVIRQRLQGRQGYSLVDVPLPEIGAGAVLEGIGGTTTLAVTEEVDGDEGSLTSVFAATGDSEGEIFQVTVSRPAYEVSFYMIDELKTRLQDARSPRVCMSLPQSLCCQTYRDGTIWAFEVLDDFTLQDLITTFCSVTQQVDETLIIYLTIELLRTLSGMHGAGIVHGNLTPSNINLRSDIREKWDQNWNVRGEGGWAERGIRVISFEHAVDTTLLAEGWSINTTGHELSPAGMRLSSSRFEIDHLGLLHTVHSLLYKAPLAVRFDEGSQRYALESPIKRYWQKDLWLPLFDELLNSASSPRPSSDMLKDLQGAFEGYLIKTKFQANKLKGFLEKAYVTIYKKSQQGCI